MKGSLLIIVIGASLFGGFFLYQTKSWKEYEWVNREVSVRNYARMQKTLETKNTKTSVEKAQLLAGEGCVLLAHRYDEISCVLDENDSFDSCYADVEYHDTHLEPHCLDYGTGHVATPDGARVIYMTSRAFALPSFRNRLVDIVKNTEINSIMIDVKEVDGYVAYEAGDKDIFPYQKNTMKNLSDVITELHEQDIYVIGRIVLFKDKIWAQNNQEHAVQRRDDPSRIWTDYGGKMFIDPGSREFWDYVVELSSVAYEAGFDEINADYIRFPSDGNMRNTYYPHSQEVIDELGAEQGRVKVLNDFMKYYTTELRSRHPEIVLSADVFGMVTTNRDDLTIGQVLEPFLLNFDYVAPMVYPSHYPKSFLDLPGHPDNHPYEVVYKSQKRAEERRIELISKNPDARIGKLRPWLQDFTCTWCAGYFPYYAPQVREQIDATYDAGQSGWMLWNAANRYTTGALEKQ